MKWKIKWNPQLFEDLVRGMQDAGEETFKISQQDGYVPVDKGTLKKSGGTEKTSTGIIVFYRTSYAAKQEFGLPAGATEDVPAHPVKAHKRKRHTITRGGRRIVVPGHKVVGHTRGPFTKTYAKGLEGRRYLGRAWDEVRPRLAWYVSKRLKSG